ncbi:MAG: GNAT family N-acetyltransferase [Chloroflexi bacterium]|nr:MAG: GNAT family N-acetyltransferase [Chloroflexota bacterium]
MTNLTYCPVCGEILGEREEGGRLRPVCSNCGYIHYHNPVPAVGMVIEMDGGIVLIQRGQPPHQGEWTLPSGFIEMDESAEEAAIREAEEETGLKVEIVELMSVNSFPEGPPVSGIIIFFRMRPVGGQLRAGDDANDVRVFKPDAIPVLPFRTHRETISEWLLQQQNDSPSSAHKQAPEFIIRPAEARDLEDISGLLALIPANRNLSQAEWQAFEQRFYEAPGVEVFVAAARQEPPIIIGFIALSIVRTLTEGRGFINDMAVLPTYQRQGVGAELLEAVMRRAERLNLRELMVNTRRANQQARAFYLALGFSDEGIMRLKLR